MDRSCWIVLRTASAAASSQLGITSGARVTGSGRLLTAAAGAAAAAAETNTGAGPAATAVADDNTDDDADAAAAAASGSGTSSGCEGVTTAARTFATAAAAGVDPNDGGLVGSGDGLRLPPLRGSGAP